MEQLCNGRYGDAAPKLAHASTFTADFNNWLQLHNKNAYFYSATRHQKYGIPRSNPRPGDGSVYRLTDLCRTNAGTIAPKAFNRVGDNGTVGGQTLVGLLALHHLLRRAEDKGIAVRCWPFDGLDIASAAYEGAHVLLEPYPSAVRSPTVRQGDSADAIASAEFLRQQDIAGNLPELLDLQALTEKQKIIVLFEGWIVSHRPGPLPERPDG